MGLPGSLLVVLVALSARAPAPGQVTQPDRQPAAQAHGELPSIPREFRGVWIATVGNMDWPSRAGLSVAEQKTELLGLLDLAKRLRLNAVVFQVRTSADALYDSPHEPWSEYLSGQMGKRPDPYWDPLAFAITEAHQRGLELHAWFNPYRARYDDVRSQVSASHISRTRPDLVRRYGSFLWMDPGSAEVRALTLRVILDVVRRYDIDGVHIDDYFYPYQERTADGRLIPFPDEPTWTAYLADGGNLARDDWRRANVDTLVHSLYLAIHAEKPAVKFGISPFGIWRPGHPEQVSGLDAYVELYADARRWLREGWLDYFAPQLYWRIAAPQQGYAALLQWWVSQNWQGRHLWPGNAPYRVLADQQRWPPHEIVDQIRLTRAQPGATGNIHFNISAFVRNRGGLADTLAAEAYAYDALVPATPWLDREPPAQPEIRDEEAVLYGRIATLQAMGTEPVFLWVVRLRIGSEWFAEVIPGTRPHYPLLRGEPARLVDEIAVSAVDRSGNESAVTRLNITKPTKSLRPN